MESNVHNGEKILFDESKVKTTKSVQHWGNCAWSADFPGEHLYFITIHGM